ncbi:hypothetical protein L209DRAFT_750132 [Thermothelomyces heterothallicus CBS 203.75]
MENLQAMLGAEEANKILAAAVAYPDDMRCFIEDIPPPSEPVEDYITEMDRRLDLFNEFQVICRRLTRLANATVLALFMVAPISEISNFLEMILRQQAMEQSLMVSGVRITMPDGIRAYLPKGSSPESLNSPRLSIPIANPSELDVPSPSNIVTRKREFSDQVKNRDGHACVFSGTSDPEAAHIFPLATSKKRNFLFLKEVLTFFWGSEKTTAWRRMFEDANITQSAKNGISMNHQIHFWFDNARFALKPLRETPEGVVVQWHWLKRSVLKPLVDIRPDQDILLQAGITDQNWGDNLAHRKSGVRIRTGQTFLIRADKPEDRLSWDLLEMQWNLLRVAAISGAADVTDDYYDYEDPDERAYDADVAAKQRAILAEHGTAITSRHARDKSEYYGGEQSKVKQARTPGDSDSERSNNDGEPGDNSGGGTA